MYKNKVAVLVSIPTRRKNGSIVADGKEMACDIDRALLEGRIEKLFPEIKYCRESNLLLLKNPSVIWTREIYEVAEFHRWLENFEDHYDGGGVQFVRIGEELTDIEEIIVGEPYEFMPIVVQTVEPIGKFKVLY